MKIALINPPDENRIFSEVPSKINEKSGVLPPLGLLYLEAYLSNSTKHQVKIFDCPAEGWDYSALEEKLNGFAPDLIGVTGHTHNLVDMLKTSKIFKKINPEGVVVWGGAHASAFPSQSAAFAEVDFVVYGEGEITFAELLNFIESGGDLPEKIEGIFYKNENWEVIKNPPRKLIVDLNSLPHPRRDVLDVSKYYYTIGRETRASGFVSSRGCPFHCTFCSTPGNKFRWRTADDVVDEMEECQRLGIRELYFVDDTFNVKKDRVNEICSEIISRGIKMSWNYRGRIDLITPKQLEMVEKAGCTRIQLGVETGTDEGLKRLRKGITTDQIRQVFRWLKKSSMTSVAYFMIGCPHEKNRDDVLKTIQFAREIDPDYVLFGVLTPYPNTEIYEEGVRRGIIDPEIWEEFVTNPTPDFRPSPWTEYFTMEDLEKYLDEAYKKFYGRPGYIVKRLLEIRSPGELWRKIKAGINVLK